MIEAAGWTLLAVLHFLMLTCVQAVYIILGTVEDYF